MRRRVSVSMFSLLSIRNEIVGLNIQTYMKTLGFYLCHIHSGIFCEFMEFMCLKLFTFQNVLSFRYKWLSSTSLAFKAFHLRLLASC